MFSFDFCIEPLIIFSYCTVVFRLNVVDLKFLVLLIDALTAGNVCKLVKDDLTSCGFIQRTAF